MSKLKENFMLYNQNLKEQRTRSISKLCNSVELCFTLFITVFLFTKISSFFYVILFIGILYCIRVVHIYFIIASTIKLKILYFSMIFFQVIVSLFLFYKVNPLLFMIGIIMMLVAFPFLFAKLEKLDK